MSARYFFPKGIPPYQCFVASDFSAFSNLSDQFDTSYSWLLKPWQVWWPFLACCFYSYSPLQSLVWIYLVENLNSRTLKESLSPPGAILMTSFGQWYLCFRYASVIVSSIIFIHQAPVVQKMDNVMHRVNYYPVDKYWGNQLLYPLDSDLSDG